MRKGWEVKKLGDVCDIFDYLRRPITKSERISGDYPYYGASGVQDYVDSFIFDGRYLLVGEDGAKWGKKEISSYIIEGKSWVNNHVHVLRLNESLIDSFVEYYLNYSDLTKYITGAVVPKLTQRALQSIIIPVPPLQTQQQIVEELDCLTSIIEKQKKQLEELDNLTQAIFYDMFGDPIENEKGWETSTIDNVCSSIIRGPFGSALKKEFFVEKDDSTYKVYEQKNAINKNAFIGEYYISKEMYKSLSRFEVFPNDIIMSCSGTIGELFVIPNEAERGIINQALLKFTLNKKIEQDYFLFMMDLMKAKLDVKGCGIQNIGSVKYIKTTTFGLPPLSLQQKFASKIEAIEKQKELIKKSIKETEDLFNSRMDYYFN